MRKLALRQYERSVNFRQHDNSECGSSVSVMEWCVVVKVGVLVLGKCYDDMW